MKSRKLKACAADENTTLLTTQQVDQTPPQLGKSLKRALKGHKDRTQP